MDKPLPPKAARLLDDLESIRALLDGDSSEPPLLTESLDPSTIPLLHEVVDPRPLPKTPLGSFRPTPPPVRPTPPGTTTEPSFGSTQRPVTAPPVTPAPPAAPVVAPATPASPQPLDQARLDAELRAAANLILQEVIDDFVPQIEAELQKRLQARLQRLLNRR